MKRNLTEIHVTFEDSPSVEIQPITIQAKASQQKRKSCWLSWFK